MLGKVDGAWLFGLKRSEVVKRGLVDKKGMKRTSWRSLLVRRRKVDGA